MVRILQLYYADSQIEQLDPDLEPLDRRTIVSELDAELWREYAVCRHSYSRRLHLKYEYFGFVSWKFRQKADLSGKKLHRFIQSNPGYDVYFVSPHPEAALLNANLWEHGEASHPRLTELTERIFRDIGVEIDIRRQVHGLANALICNYWVGNARFWNAYMEFTDPIMEYAARIADPKYHRLIYSLASVESGANYFPFLMERLFSTLLCAEPGIKGLGYRYSSEEMLLRYGARRAKLLEVAESLKEIEIAASALDPNLTDARRILRHEFYAPEEYSGQAYRAYRVGLILLHPSSVLRSLLHRLNAAIQKIRAGITLKKRTRIPGAEK